MGLFDKIVSKATEVGSDAAREASKAAEQAPIKLAIHGLQGKRQEQIEQLGQVALKLYRENAIAHESLASVVATITSIEDELAAKEAQIEAVEEKYKSAPKS